MEIPAFEEKFIEIIFEKEHSIALQKYSLWLNNNKLDKIHGGVYRLIPMLHKRLSETKQHYENMDQTKSIYCLSLHRNYFMIHRAKSLFAELQRNAIPFLLLKGISLVSSYYDDIATRPMSDIDFLVHDVDLRRTIDVMASCGWKCDHLPSEYQMNHLEYCHALHFHARDGMEMDLHWYVIPQCCWKNTDENYWKTAEPICLLGDTYLSPSPAMQLLHICIHGTKQNDLSPIRWIVDALMILKKRNQSIDWEMLFDEAKQKRVTLALGKALQYLSEKFHAPIPQNTIEKLMRHPVHGYLSFRWYMHSRNLESKPLWQKLISFPDHLALVWGLKGKSKIPLYLIKKIFQKWKKISRFNIVKILRNQD